MKLNHLSSQQRNLVQQVDARQVEESKVNSLVK